MFNLYNYKWNCYNEKNIVIIKTKCVVLYESKWRRLFLQILVILIILIIYKQQTNVSIKQYDNTIIPIYNITIYKLLLF